MLLLRRGAAAAAAAAAGVGFATATTVHAQGVPPAPLRPTTCRASLRALAGNPFSRGPGTPARSPGPAAGSHPAAGRGWSWPDPDTFAFPPSETPTRLFDGHSFAGWSGKIGRYWTIENGAIKAIMSPYDAPPVSTYLFSGACRALAFLSRHRHSHTHAMVS